MALSGENAGLVMTLKKTTAPCRPSRCPPLFAAPIPVDMTIVCIDIFEKISIESRKTNGQPPFRRT